VILGCAAVAVGAIVAMSYRQAANRTDVDGGNQHATVIVRNLESPGTFEIENAGSPIALWSQVTLQRLENGTWRDDNETELSLEEVCVWNAQPSCQTLQRGGRLHPHPWNGLSCGGQCPESCRANSFLGPGQFRFVVTACDRKRHFPGPSFSLPDYDHSQLKMTQHSSSKPAAKK
jgi:hypothetical protein